LVVGVLNYSYLRPIIMLDSINHEVVDGRNILNA
jgi:hypothetical protein